MMEALKPLIDSEIINEEARMQIQEAWESKLAEARETIRSELYEEISRQFEHDKEVMVESLDKMVNEQLTTELSKIEKEREKLEEDRVKYNLKMNEQSEMFNNFMVDRLGEEIIEFRKDRDERNRVFENEESALRKDRIEAKLKLDEQNDMIKDFIVDRLNTEIQEFNEDRRVYTERMDMIQEFVVNTLAEEIAEFHEDKQAVVEARVKLIAEGKDELDKLKKSFVIKNGKLVKETVEKRLQYELRKFEDDINEAKKNKFGRKIYEAFSAEFGTSYLNENDEIRDLQRKLEIKSTQLDEATSSVEKTSTLIERKDAEIRKINNRLVREDKMSKMLEPLNNEQKRVMKELLAETATNDLDDAFDKYFKVVLKNSENVNSFNANIVNEVILTETREITGNKKQPESEKFDQELAQMKYYAGLKS